MTYRTRRLATLAALAACAAPASLAAQATDANGRIAYDAAFFRTFAPANALQLVARVPGFTLELPDEEVRGFASAAGNVVINGQRPSSKSDTLETVLARIPASRVLRVEIGRGDAFGSEYSGKAQVLNLILSASAGLAGTAEGTVRREYAGAVLPEATVSALLRRGPSTFNVSVGLDNAATTEEGYDRITTLPGGVQTEFRDKVNRIRDPNGFVSAAWELNSGTNRTAHLNGRLAHNRFRLTQTNIVTLATGIVRDDQLTQRYDRDEYELGGDITRPLAKGAIKLIGLATRRDRRLGDVSLLGALGGFTQDVADRRDEAVTRLVWNRPDLLGWTFEMGAEAVRNSLISDVDLFGIDPAGTPAQIDLPVDQATVTEYRGETFVNAGRALTPRLRLDIGLTVETSRLTVTGDAQAERALTFPKPKATLDWRIDETWRAQLSLQRTVAQLQFEDFISLAELANERINGGNAELLPQRAWEVLATVQRPILGNGLIKLEAGYNRISLVQDRVPTPEGFDAPGNLGNGTSYVARATIDAPLSTLGIKGGRLSLFGAYFASSVEDPYTRRNRAFSSATPFEFEASFRQDLGSFAWGFTLEGYTRATAFRRNELDEFYGALPQVSAFAEYRPTATTTVTFGIDNLTDVPAGRDRTFFTPDRTATAPNLFETRVRNRHVVPYLTVKHSFG